MITKKVLWILLMTVFPLLSVTAQSVNDDNDYQKYLEDQRKTEEAIDIIENSGVLERKAKEALEKHRREMLKREEEARLKREAEKRRQEQETLRRKKAQQQKELDARRRQEQGAIRQQEQMARRQQMEAEAEERRRAEQIEVERRRAERMALQEARGQAAYRETMQKTAVATAESHRNIDRHAQDQARVRGEVEQVVAARHEGLTPLTVISKAVVATDSKSGSGAKLMKMMRDRNDAKREQEVANDVTEFVKTYADDVISSGFDPTLFCNYLIEKACERHKVSKLAFTTMSCDEQTRAKIIADIENGTAKANKLIRQKEDDWNAKKNVPKWHDLSNAMNDNQLISTLNIMSTSNKGKLPTPLCSDDNYYYYMLVNSGELARVSKTKKGAIDIIQSDLRYATGKSFSGFLKNGADPVVTYSQAFKNGAGLRQYAINKDGSAKGKSVNEAGASHEYSIGKPAVKFYTGIGPVFVNEYADTEERNREGATKIFVNFTILNSSFKHSYDLINGDVEHETNADAHGSFYESDKGGSVYSSVSANNKEFSPKGYAKVKSGVGPGGHVSGSITPNESYSLSAGVGGIAELGFSENNKDGTSLGVNVKAGKGKNSLAYSYEKNEDKVERSHKIQGGVGTSYSSISGSVKATSSDDSEYTKISRKLTISPLDWSNDYVGVQVGASIGDSYEKHEQSNADTQYINQLPADIAARLYRGKIAEVKKQGVVMYDNFEIDDADVLSKKPVPASEMDKMMNMMENVLEENKNTQDYEVPKSNFNGFTSCYALSEDDGSNN